MTSYTRSPETITVHCTLCPWLRTVFADNSKHKSLQHRAILTLAAHIRAKHRRKVTLINGR